MSPLLPAGFLVFPPRYSEDTEAQSKRHDGCSQGLAPRQGATSRGRCLSFAFIPMAFQDTSKSTQHPSRKGLMGTDPQTSSGKALESCKQHQTPCASHTLLLSTDGDTQ